MIPANQPARWRHFLLGRGFAGVGKSSIAVPRIAGRKFPYLRRQIEKAAQLHLDLAPAEMASSPRGMRDHAS